jgi:hypothetical protein
MSVNMLTWTLLYQQLLEVIVIKEGFVMKWLQVNTVQQTLVEAWGIVQGTYVDPTFNNQGSTTFVPKICCQILFVGPRASCLCCLDRVKDTCANTNIFLCSNSNTFFFMGSILKQIGISSWKRYWERLCHWRHQMLHMPRFAACLPP